jgi:hypothetical protein
MAKINCGHLVGKYLKDLEKVDLDFVISCAHLE